MKLSTAVIPVAGLGTRFLPITRTVPKELLPIIDTPIIHHIVCEARDAGIKNIVFVNSYGKHSIENYFHLDPDDSRYKHKPELLAELGPSPIEDMNIITVRQNKPLGLGHAILCAKECIQEPFAILLGDDLIDANPPCIKQLMNIHEKMDGAPVVAVMEVAKQDTKKYGIIKGHSIENRLFKVDGLVEKPTPEEAPSQLAIPGRYILTPDIFPILEKTKASKSGEIQLTDAIHQLAQKRSLYAYQFEGLRFDAGDKLGFIMANVYFALKRDGLGDQLRAQLKTLLALK